MKSTTSTETTDIDDIPESPALKVLGASRHGSVPNLDYYELADLVLLASWHDEIEQAIAEQMRRS